MDQLASIKVKVNRLYMMKVLGLFPEVSALLEIESKYGETITMEDMEGITQSEEDRHLKTYANNIRTANKFIDAVHDSIHEKQQALHDVHKQSSKRKADTDSKNEEFEKHLAARANREPVDIVKLHYALQREIKARVLEIRKKREEEFNRTVTEPVYIYGGQKLNVGVSFGSIHIPRYSSTLIHC